MTTSYTDFYRLLDDERRYVDAIVLRYVLDAYRWRRPGEPEPRVSVADLADYLDQHGRCPLRLRGVRRRVYLAVAASTRRLVRRGALETSLGCGRGDRESRLFAPTATSATDPVLTGGNR